jgi:hypothetical protein
VGKIIWFSAIVETISGGVRNKNNIKDSIKIMSTPNYNMQLQFQLTHFLCPKC